MKPETRDQDALIAAAQAGDADAFERLLQLHYDRMYRFACKWCGNRIDAQDITQQACIKLARSLEQFRFDASFTTWLYQVVVTCAIDWQRREGRHSRDSGRLHEDTDGARPESGIYLQQLLQQLESWGEGFKDTLLLVLAEGLTHAEAATVLKVKESTVSWRLHEIRRRLRLTESGDGLDGGRQT